MSNETYPTLTMTRTEWEATGIGGEPTEFITSIHPGPDGYGLSRLTVTEE